MKKVISTLLAAAMILSLTACSNTTVSNDNQSGSSAETQATDSDAIAGDGNAETVEPTEVTVTGMDANGNPIEVTVPYNASAAL